VKLYRIRVQSAGEGCILGWATSKAKAIAKRREIEAALGDADPDAGTIDAVEIETTREGLCRWLNVHFNSDNG
jgi:hypothetical protein